MSSKRSRWDEEEEEEDQDIVQKKKDKKKKQKKIDEHQQLQEKSTTPAESTAVATPLSTTTIENNGTLEHSEGHPELPSTRRRRRSPPRPPPRLFALECPPLMGCRHVDIYEKLNHIEEGSYGIVYRARDTETGQVVALKKLKLEREKNGFPITSLREISTLMAARHPNIVNIREVVMGDSLSQYATRLIVLCVGCLSSWTLSNMI